jgi:hypothetical protein
MGLRRKTIGSAKPPPWEVQLRAKIEELRRLEQKAFGPRHGKTDFHKYLKGVFNKWDWADPKVSRRVGRRVAKLYKIDTRKNKTPIHVVIDATCKQDRQTKSRWAQAVEYAVATGARGDAFKKWLKKNGGVYGCATKMAALRKQKRASKQSSWARTWGKKKRPSLTK